MFGVRGGLVVTENRMKKTPLLVFVAREGDGRVVPSHHPHSHCTPFAPHKQLLIAAVGGAVIVVILGSSLSSCPWHCCHCCPALLIAVVLPSSSLLSCCAPPPHHHPALASPPSCCCYSTHYLLRLLYKQLLVRLGVGGVLSIVIVCHCSLSTINT
jgi:hypothetical protein